MHHLTKVLLWFGIAAPVAIFVFMLWASAITPNYSYVSNTVSQLSAQGQPYPAIMGIGFVVFGLLMNGFAFGLYQSLGRGRTNVGVLVGLLIFGTCILLLVFFRDYNVSPGMLQNLEGHLHKLIAQIALVGLLLAMFHLTRTAYGRPGWQSIPCVTAIAAIIVVVFGLLSLVLSESIQGLLQRGLYGIALVWIIIVSITAKKHYSYIR